MTVKMAVFAPIPRASVSTAAAVNPGVCRSSRAAKRDVLKYGLEEGKSPGFARRLPDQRQVAGVAAGRSGRFLQRHAPFQVRVDLHLQMCVDLFMQILFDPFSFGNRRQPGEPFAHWDYFSAARTRAMASTNLLHRELAAIRCLRPAGVSW